MNAIKLLVGADPEIFVRKIGRKTFTSAHGMVKGDKKAPLKVERGAVQVDGMALEFNIDPAADEKEFILNLTTVQQIMAGMIDKRYELVKVPVADFTKHHMSIQPPEAVELGCEPDYNAWNGGAANPRPNGDRTFRTGAGHVHIGWTKDVDVNHPDHQQACIMLTKQLDYYLGLGSLVYDTDKRRRTLYGAAGAFRPKHYGVEYRVLSNAWLQSEEIMGWVYRMTKLGFEKLVDGDAAYEKHGTWARKLLKDKNPSTNLIAHFLQDLGIECPPGFKCVNHWRGRDIVKV